jgi:tetratricopeptide (TPR) repeat protein
VYAKKISACFAGFLCLMAASPREKVDGLVAPSIQDSSEFARGYRALREGHFYDAIRALRRAEKLDPSPNVLKALAISYYGAHQQRLFLLKMREAQRKQPDDFAPYYYLGRYYDTDVTDFARAAGYFRQALARKPDHYRSHYYLGHCYEVQQKLAQAEAEYRLALPANDGLADQGLSRLRLAANRPADALPFARRAVELAPRDVAARKLLARTYSELGREAEAAPEWKISTELDPTDASAWFRLYRCYVGLGKAQQSREALAEYKRIARLYGTN